MNYNILQINNHNKMVRQFKKQNSDYILDVSLNQNTIQIELFSMFPYPPKYFHSVYQIEDIGACSIICDSLQKLYMFLYNEQKNYVVMHRQGIIKLFFQIATNKQTVTRAVSIKLDQSQMKIRPVDKNKKSQSYSQSQQQQQPEPQYKSIHNNSQQCDNHQNYQQNQNNINNISSQKMANSSKSTNNNTNVDDFIKQVTNHMQELHQIIQQKLFKYQNQNQGVLGKRIIQMVDQRQQQQQGNHDKNRNNQEHRDIKKIIIGKNTNNNELQISTKKQKQQSSEHIYKFSRELCHDQIKVTNDFSFSNYYAIITESLNTVILIQPKIKKKKKNPTLALKITTANTGYAIGVCQINKIKAADYNFTPRSDGFYLMGSDRHLYIDGYRTESKMNINTFQEIRMTMFYNDDMWILRFWDAIQGDSDVIQIFQDQADLAFCVVNFGNQFAGTICNYMEDP